MAIKVKRIYEPYLETDGYRVLVDRLWPRGIKKEEARIDKWLKDISPSTQLRKWFDHDPAKWQQFLMKYHGELNNTDILNELRTEMHKHKTITLLYAAKDEEHNNAVALLKFLKD